MTATARQLAQAVRQIEAWDDTVLTNADRILVTLTMQACIRRNDSEGIGDIQRTITRITRGTGPGAALPSRFRERWSAFADLLEARRLQLAGAAPAEQLERKHVPEILRAAIAAKGRLLQREIATSVCNGVTAGRISQLLGLMESHGLIERIRHGRDKLIVATELAGSLVGNDKNLRRHSSPARPSAPRSTVKPGEPGKAIAVQ